jgi:acyl-coenzyme A thioesterase PaaI-like protein
MAPAGHWVLTAEFKTSLLRAGRGQRLECVGVVVKAGRQLSFTEADGYAINGDERTLIAKATATMAVVKA